VSCADAAPVWAGIKTWLAALYFLIQILTNITALDVELGIICLQTERTAAVEILS
jgi:hypothetical protein